MLTDADVIVNLSTGALTCTVLSYEELWSPGCIPCCIPSQLAVLGTEILLPPPSPLKQHIKRLYAHSTLRLCYSGLFDLS